MDGFTQEHRPLYEVKANLFRGLAHPVRVRVLEVIVERGPLPVSALLIDTGVEASNLSQHLSVLRQHNLVTAERHGSHVIYQLSHPQVAEILADARSLLAAIVETRHQQLQSAMSATR
ncbi:MAG TPA: metalloregulator ArsR/SmtB family transcription factor [Glaciihabitans sp.]|jgi:ArsR family transcriptional regulator|nr:metalloregulator ArsR/SmtB family transcription factor [Glaciihabitans sp.]